jgi:hypothetical protein
MKKNIFYKPSYSLICILTTLSLQTLAQEPVPETTRLEPQAQASEATQTPQPAQPVPTPASATEQTTPSVDPDLAGLQSEIPSELPTEATAEPEPTGPPPVFGTWPSELKMTRLVFSPQLSNYFADSEGLQGQNGFSEEPDKFVYLFPDPLWMTNQSCDTPTWKKGLIQTSIFSRSTGVLPNTVSVPVKIKFQSRLTSSKKAALLKTALFTVNIFEVNANDMTLVPLTEPKRVTFEMLCDESEICRAGKARSSTRLELNYEYAFRTGSFPLELGKNYQVRVDWSPRVLCNMENSDFAIGDQIRLLQIIP